MQKTQSRRAQAVSSDGQRVRVGIIGVGQIGQRHLKQYYNIDGAEVVAIADVDEEKVAQVGARYDVAHAYTDFRQMLARDDIDAVDVCVHTNLHMPVSVAALQAGKHVYCEKPMAGSYADAAKMREAAVQSQRHLSIQISPLFMAEVKAAKALIDGGYLGRLYHAQSAGHRRRGRPYVDGYGSPAFVQRELAGGGALLDMGVYHIAAILYLLDNPDVLRVSGSTYQQLPMDPARKEASGYDVEELAIGLVRLREEITLYVIEAWAIHLDRLGGSYVVGTQGGVRLEPFGFFHSAGPLDFDSTTNLELFDLRLQSFGEQERAHQKAQRHWIAALLGKVPLLATAELALTSMLISEGIYLSQKLGREVMADEIRAASISTAVEV
ncbi:MAG TPA: Gfo/Idh/MocA family oxidoreductase [Anaerolineae bacterium]